MTCQHCGTETTNGLALCALCQVLAGKIFEILPVYLRNLARQRRPARPNGSLGTAGQWLMRRGETDGSRINAALDRAYNDLDTWAECLRDDRDVELPTRDTDIETAVALCSVLEDHLTSIATLAWAGEFVREIARHERILRALTETVVPGWYAGACRQVKSRTLEGDVFVCGTDTFVVPGLTWVTCGGCGTTTYARDHLGVILEEARDWVATPRGIAVALVAMLNNETDVERLWERIRRWGRPESKVMDKRTGDVRRVIPAGPLHEVSVRRLDSDGDEVGARLFRLGDVLDQLQRETRTLTRAG